MYRRDDKKLLKVSMLRNKDSKSNAFFMIQMIKILNVWHYR